MTPEERREFEREIAAEGPPPGRSMNVTAAVLLGVFTVAVFLVPLLGSLFLMPLALAVVIFAALGIGKGDRLFGAMVLLALPVLWILAAALGGPSGPVLGP